MNHVLKIFSLTFMCIGCLQAMERRKAVPSKLESEDIKMIRLSEEEQKELTQFFKEHPGEIRLHEEDIRMLRLSPEEEREVSKFHQLNLLKEAIKGANVSQFSSILSGLNIAQLTKEESKEIFTSIIAASKNRPADHQAFKQMVSALDLRGLSFPLTPEEKQELAERVKVDEAAMRSLGLNPMKIDDVIEFLHRVGESQEQHKITQEKGAKERLK